MLFGRLATRSRQSAEYESTEYDTAQYEQSIPLLLAQIAILKLERSPLFAVLAFGSLLSSSFDASKHVPEEGARESGGGVVGFEISFSLCVVVVVDILEGGLDLTGGEGGRFDVGGEGGGGDDSGCAEGVRIVFAFRDVGVIVRFGGLSHHTHSQLIVSLSLCLSLLSL